LEAKDCYQQWRSMEEFINYSTSEAMKLQVPQMRLPANYANSFSQLYERSVAMAETIYAKTHPRFDPHLCACLLYQDNHQEANIGIYEPRDCMWLDQHHPTDLHAKHKIRYWEDLQHTPVHLKDSGDGNGSSSSSSSSSSSNNSKRSNDTNRVNYPYEWAVLYFRQHLVAAHYQKDIHEVTIYNTASSTFLSVDGGDSTKKGRNLLKLYTSKWEQMSRMLWSPTGRGSGVRVNVVHLGVQGANDCGIWTWLLPKIIKDPEFQILCDVTSSRKKKTGRAKEKGLNAFFQKEVLGVLEQYVATVDTEGQKEGGGGSVGGGVDGVGGVGGGGGGKKEDTLPKKKRKKKKRIPKYQLHQCVRGLWVRGDIYYDAVVINVNAEKVTYDILYDDDNQIEKGVLERYIDVRRDEVVGVEEPAVEGVKAATTTSSSIKEVVGVGEVAGTIDDIDYYTV
jgi:hypothetical protein